MTLYHCTALVIQYTKYTELVFSDTVNAASDRVVSCEANHEMPVVLPKVPCVTCSLLSIFPFLFLFVPKGKKSFPFRITICWICVGTYYIILRKNHACCYVLQVRVTIKLGAAENLYYRCHHYLLFIRKVCLPENVLSAHMYLSCS